MNSLSLKIPLRLNDLVAYTTAFFLAFWCLGRSIPLVGLGYFTVGLLLLFYLSLLLFMGRRFYLKHAWLWFAFLGPHFLLINYAHKNPENNN